MASKNSERHGQLELSFQLGTIIWLGLNERQESVLHEQLLLKQLAYNKNSHSGKVYNKNSHSGKVYNKNSHSGEVYNKNSHSGKVYFFLMFFHNVFFRLLNLPRISSCLFYSDKLLGIALESDDSLVVSS